MAGPDDTKGDDLYSEEFLKKLALRIQFIRKSKGFKNYEEFANRHNLPRAQIGRYEKGQNLRIASLVKLVRAFDMTLQEFFSEGF